jgi:hypothetical protein
VGIGEIELLDDDEAPDAGGGPDGRRSGMGGSGWEPPHRFRPWPPSPSIAVGAVVVTVVAALCLALLPGRLSGGRFDLAVVSASYSTAPNETGIVLSVSVENLGSSMVELTQLAVAQPGLVPSGTNGGFMQAGLPTAVPPGQEVSVPLVFTFDCKISSRPPAATTADVDGFDANGVARTATLRLPASADPWAAEGQARPSFCAIPAPQNDLTVSYGGTDNVAGPASLAHFAYTVLLTAPPTRSINIAGLTHDNPGVIASFDPDLPMTVLDGQTIRLTVTWRILNCALAQDGAGEADGVEIMASNQREAENWVAHLGQGFAHDMAADIGAACSGASVGSTSKP